MSLMANPMEVLFSLQQALNDGMPVDPNELFEGYKMFYDEPFVAGKRYSFAKIINRDAHAISIFGLEDSIDGVICYNVGYAVNENQRGNGLALEAVNIGIAKLKNELKRSLVTNFYLEALIDKNNLYSLKVAAKLFASSGIEARDSETGTLALYFKKLITI